MGSGTRGGGLVPAEEFRSEGEKDGMSRLCTPFIFPVRDSHIQTERATSGTLVHLSARLPEAINQPVCVNPAPTPTCLHPYPSKANP